MAATPSSASWSACTGRLSPFCNASRRWLSFDYTKPVKVALNCLNWDGAVECDWIVVGIPRAGSFCMTVSIQWSNRRSRRSLRVHFDRFWWLRTVKCQHIVPVRSLDRVQNTKLAFHSVPSCTRTIVRESVLATPVQQRTIVRASAGVHAIDSSGSFSESADTRGNPDFSMCSILGPTEDIALRKLRMDRVVPLAVKFAGLQIDMGKLFICNLSPDGVLAVIQATGHFQSPWPSSSRRSVAPRFRNRAAARLASWTR